MTFATAALKSQCGTLSYEIVNSDDSPIDSALFTYASTPSLKVYSEDTSTEKVYILRVKAWLTDFATYGQFKG